MKKVLVGLVLALTIWGGIEAVLGDTLKECQVPQDYRTIQNAVDDKTCDVVIIAPGTYRGALKVFRSVILKGAGYNETIVDGLESVTVYIDGDITVTIENLTITGGDDGISTSGKARVTIRNSNISTNRGSDVSSGIEAWEFSQVTIEHNLISGNWFNGIWVSESAQATIRFNKIFGNDANGILLLEDAKVEITDNEIMNNGWCGIKGSQVFPFTGELKGERNSLSHNKDGDLCPPEGPGPGIPWPPNFIGIPEGPVGPVEELPKCPSDSIVLEPNEFMTGQKIGGKALTDTKEQQYCIFVAEGAKLLAIKLESKGNLDLHIRQGKPIERSGSAIIADYSLPSPDGNEFLIIFAPQLKKGPHFIAVENKEDSAQEFTLIATPIFDIQEIKGSAEGQVDPNAGLIPFLRQYLATRGGMLSLTQYKFDVPDGAKSVTVRLEGPPDKNLNLHLRHDKLVEIVKDQVAADLSVIGPGGQKGVVLAGTLLKAGRWYIAVESLQPNEKVNYKVVVEIETGTQKIMMVLEREPKK